VRADPVVAEGLVGLSRAIVDALPTRPAAAVVSAVPAFALRLTGLGLVQLQGIGTRVCALVRRYDHFRRGLVCLVQQWKFSSDLRLVGSGSLLGYLG
jgi:hypothetical protein